MYKLPIGINRPKITIILPVPVKLYINPAIATTNLPKNERTREDAADSRSGSSVRGLAGAISLFSAGLSARRSRCRRR